MTRCSPNFQTAQDNAAGVDSNSLFKKEFGACRVSATPLSDNSLSGGCAGWAEARRGDPGGSVRSEGSFDLRGPEGFGR